MTTAIEEQAQEAISQYVSARSGGGTSALTSWNGPLPAGPDRFFLRCQFAQLLQAWKRDTGHVASAARTVLHPAYQAIIGMGQQALPLILEELQRSGGHWFWALSSIAQEDPAQGCVGFSEAARAWLEWGRLHGYLRS